MITPEMLIDCQGLLPEIRATFDLPWEFLGEVRPGRPSIKAICGRCSPRNFSFNPFLRCVMSMVHLQSFLVVTDDMIEVELFWGQCERCKSVLWARSGPPFRRARCYVPAGA